MSVTLSNCGSWLSLKVSKRWGFQIVSSPDAMNGAVRKPVFFARSRESPVGHPRRRSLESRRDDLAGFPRRHRTGLSSRPERPSWVKRVAIIQTSFSWWFSSCTVVSGGLQNPSTRLPRSLVPSPKSVIYSGRRAGAAWIPHRHAWSVFADRLAQQARSSSVTDHPHLVLRTRVRQGSRAPGSRSGSKPAGWERIGAPAIHR
jgi:hypothetical protein